MCTDSNEKPILVRVKAKSEDWKGIVGNVKANPTTTQPHCWNPNDSAYPLCKGEVNYKGGQVTEECKECCIWEGYGPPQSYYDR